MGKLALESGQTVLFIGDSITDCGRRAEAAPYGAGYVGLLIDMITARWPELDLKYLNMGIGGNKITDLRARWHEDVMAYQPEWLGVKIGINDLHSFLRGAPDGVGVSLFRETYDSILQEAVEGFAPQLVLIEPFYIAREDTPDPFQQQVLSLIREYIAVVHEMAEKYRTRLVRTHEAFARQLQYREPSYFCPEPVHPYRNGHMVIANAVLDALVDD
ncbi:MAG: SGNH/GDSL hydrolase family protein [Candidatus Zipacnadales bacterium]